MSRTDIEQLLYLMDEAFKDNPFHSLLKNLESVREEDWLWLPLDGERSIFNIVEHLGARYAYENHAFGDRSMRWGPGPGSNPTIQRDTPRNEVIEWLREGFRRLRESVAALTDDEELRKPRMAPWGTEANTRWLINTMIQHDLYHAGEINHIRALHQKNDE